MKKGQFNFCGEDLYVGNAHWLAVYGNLLILLSKLDMKDTCFLLDYPSSEYDDTKRMDYEDGVTAVRVFFTDRAFFVEGYTLQEIVPWFIDYCHRWHSQNVETQRKVMADKIEKLQKELKDLGGA